MWEVGSHNKNCPFHDPPDKVIPAFANETLVSKTHEHKPDEWHTVQFPKKKHMAALGKKQQQKGSSNHPVTLSKVNPLENDTLLNATNTIFSNRRTTTGLTDLEINGNDTILPTKCLSLSNKFNSLSQLLSNPIGKNQISLVITINPKDLDESNSNISMPSSIKKTNPWQK